MLQRVLLASRTDAPAPSFVVCEFIFVCKWQPGPVRLLTEEAALLYRIQRIRLRVLDDRGIACAGAGAAPAG